MLIVIHTVHNHQISVIQPWCRNDRSPLPSGRGRGRLASYRYINFLFSHSIHRFVSSNAPFLSFVASCIRPKFSSLSFQTINQSLYSPPHDPHLPSEIDAVQTTVAMEKRAAKITSLNERISKIKRHLCQSQEKELETLRPIMDQHHARICKIQQEMARLWTEYTARMAAAQETETRVTTLQKCSTFLKQENSKPQSFLAPIRRLP